MNSSPATQKQIDFILSLAGVSYLSQVPRYYGLSMRERRGQISKARASEIITLLKTAAPSR